MEKEDIIHSVFDDSDPTIGFHSEIWNKLPKPPEYFKWVWGHNRNSLYLIYEEDDIILQEASWSLAGGEIYMAEVECDIAEWFIKVVQSFREDWGVTKKVV